MKLIRETVAMGLMLLVLTAAVLGVAAAISKLTHPCDPDPWACFGAGRYDAMRDGRVCECYQKEHLQ